MLYVFGVREVSITIVSDPDEPGFLAHVIEKNSPHLWDEVGGEAA